MFRTLISAAGVLALAAAAPAADLEIATSARAGTPVVATAPAAGEYEVTSDLMGGKTWKVVVGEDRRFELGAARSGVALLDVKAAEGDFRHTGFLVLAESGGTLRVDTIDVSDQRRDEPELTAAVWSRVSDALTKERIGEVLARANIEGALPASRAVWLAAPTHGVAVAIGPEPLVKRAVVLIEATIASMVDDGRLMAGEADTVRQALRLDDPRIYRGVAAEPVIAELETVATVAAEHQLGQQHARLATGALEGGAPRQFFILSLERSERPTRSERR